MDLEDHEAQVDSSDVMQAVRCALPDGHCRDIFDIHSGQGSSYSRFAKSYGDGEPRVNHIAEFLGITPRAVKQHSEQILVVCVAHGLSPASR